MSEQANEKTSKDIYDPFTWANFNRWAARAYWTPQELAALSLSKDPRSLNLEQCQSEFMSPYCIEYIDRHDTIRRACEVEQIAWRIAPNKGVEWMKRYGMPFPPKLAEEVNRFYPVTNWEHAFYGVLGWAKQQQDELLEQIEHHQSALEMAQSDSAYFETWKGEALAFMRDLVAHNKTMSEKIEEMEKVCSDMDSGEAISASNDNEAGASATDPRRYHSALRVIFGMAADKFHLAAEGELGKSTATNVQSALDRSGIQLGIKTTRSLLAEAKALFQDKGK
jgi:hypothetical protein